MNFDQIMEELELQGSAQTRKIYTNHGADLPMFGVSMKHLKIIAKKVKRNHTIGMKLLHSKNVDAIYLSRWIVDPKQITRDNLEHVLLTTDYYMLIDNVVAHIAGSNDLLADECLQEWLHHENDRFRQSAYSLYAMILSSRDNDSIDFKHVAETLNHVKINIHQEQNRVRYSMNNFVISAGVIDKEISLLSKAVARAIGKVTVSMGKTSCKVPDAEPYIDKIIKMGLFGKKRKLT